jgi:hypothetical protein
VSESAKYVQALASTGDALGGNARQALLSASSATPAYVIESAEGIVTYPGFGKDGASKKARRWLIARLADYDVADDSGDAGPERA